MYKYHKIQTIFRRDPNNKYKTLLEGEFSEPEFEYLAKNKWYVEEKIDGTNIRIIWKDGHLSFGGKTDAAQIPANLVEWLRTNITERLMSSVFSFNVCLYGEGYGSGIQKGGNYSLEQKFILFDVRVDNIWLERHSVIDIANKLDIDHVPHVGYLDLYEVVERVKQGFYSMIAEEERLAEGIVARPTCELLNRRGERIITKLKHRDFTHGT